MSSTVDSTPIFDSPPSNISSILPSRSEKTCSAVVGLGEPEILALGAAIGVSDARISESATACLGILTATVSKPATVMSGTVLLRLNRSVSGPGQNSSISLFAVEETSVVSFFKSL